jgi:hypothetical protein
MDTSTADTGTVGVGGSERTAARLCSRIRRRVLTGEAAVRGAAAEVAGSAVPAQASNGDPVLQGIDNAGAGRRTAVFTSSGDEFGVLAGPDSSGKGPVGVCGLGQDSGLPGFGRTGAGVTGLGGGAGAGVVANCGSCGGTSVLGFGGSGPGGSGPSVRVLSVPGGRIRPGGLRMACRFLALWRVLAVPVLLGMVIVGVCPGVASASAAPTGHLRTGPHPVPRSGLSLARAPAGLRAAVRRTLGLPGAPAASAFQQAKLTAADAAPNDYFGYSMALSGSTAVVGAPVKNSGTGAAYVFVRSGTAWTQQAKLTAASGAAGDSFGWSVALSGSTAVVGAFGKNANAGAAYVFVRSGTAWTQQAKLTAADAAPGDFFGWSVALSGSTAVVGAFAKNSNTGAAYVFVQSGTAWTQQAKLTAADAAAFDDFGASVALSGSTAMVGATSGNSGAGAAYVFVRSGTAWTQQAELTAADAAPGDDFGASVALSGSTAVVGDNAKNSSTGAAYVFVRSGTAWSQQAELTAADAAPGDELGYSVALSGSTAVVAAPYKNSQTGAAYVYVLPSQQAKLTATGGAANDRFGVTVALSGSTAVVGVPAKNSNTGAAYVFVRSGTAWTQQAKLTAADAAAGAEFGYSVALSGATAVLGAPFSGGTGAAYVFTRSGTAWSQQAKLTAAGTAWLGFSVALSGSTAVLGAPATNSFTGAAYVFAQSGTAWTQQATLTAAGGAPDDEFGYAVALSGPTAVLGALGTNSAAGAAYVFVQSGTAWTQQAKLTAADAAPGDFLGASVALSGPTAVIGAWAKNSNTGAAYVFIQSGTAWTQQAKLTAAGGAPGDQFGVSVALSGSTAIVGADGTNTSTGTAYVFVRSGTAWTQQATLTAADATPASQFGYAVALSGTTAIVGAPAKNTNTGAAYVYVTV